MKKLILSAAFALACFTAQANNEVIKNDDDKNPKSKTKVVKAEKKSPGNCQRTVELPLNCPDGPGVVVGIGTASTCLRAFLNAYYAAATAGC